MKYSLNYFKQNYPKTRPRLDPKIEKIYDAQYIDNREGNSLMSNFAKILESWMHNQVSNTIKTNSKLLEIGAGTLNHVSYEKYFSSYDVIEPFQKLVDQSNQKHLIHRFYNDIDEANDKCDTFYKKHGTCGTYDDKLIKELNHYHILYILKI